MQQSVSSEAFNKLAHKL